MVGAMRGPGLLVEMQGMAAAWERAVREMRPPGSPGVTWALVLD